MTGPPNSPLTIQIPDASQKNYLYILPMDWVAGRWDIVNDDFFGNTIAGLSKYVGEYQWTPGTPHGSLSQLVYRVTEKWMTDWGNINSEVYV